MAPNRKAAPKRKAVEAKAAIAPPSREVRRKIVAKKVEKLKVISHPSHGKVCPVGVGNAACQTAHSLFSDRLPPRLQKNSRPLMLKS